MGRFIPAEEALNIPDDRKQASKWPVREKGSRLEPFARPFLFPRFHLQQSDKIFTIGSCFARNIEEYLFRLGFDVPALHFSAPASEHGGRANGILNKYTVISMLQEVDRTKRAHDAAPDEVTGIISEPLLHLSADKVVDLELLGMRPVNALRAVERRQQVNELFQKIYDSNVVVLTFGLIEAWYDALTCRYIQSAPMPFLNQFPNRFFYKQIGFDEGLESCRQIIKTLNSMGVSKRIIVTTSPVPIARTFSRDDVLVANMQAKAFLRTISAILAQENENVDYFPSFEMVMLSRDPSVWNDDLVHVSDQLVGSIVTSMIEAYCPTLKQNLSAEKQASFHLAKKDFAAATATLGDKPEDKTPTIELLRGLALAGSGDAKSGYVLVRDNCLTAEPDPDQAIRVAAMLCYQGDLDLCRSFIDRMVPLHQHSVQVVAILLARKALVLARLGLADDARAFARESLQVRRNIVVLNIAAEALCEIGDYDGAEQLFSEVVTTLLGAEVKSAIRGSAYAGLSLVAAKRGDRASATKFLMQAEEQYPRSPLGLAAKRLLLKTQGKRSGGRMSA